MVTFDPDRVAALECDGWRAYYDRRWARLLRLMIILCHEQFHIPLSLAPVAAYHATRAVLAWAPLDHDPAAVQTHYTRFYRLAQRYSGLRFDPRRVAALELEYNAVHRRLVGESDKEPFVEVLTRLHAALFGLTPQQARESAEQRVLANTVVDRITSGASTDTAADWVLIREALSRAYRSIQAHLPHASTPEPPEAARGPEYAFATIWQVDAPVDTVWEAISHSERWPSWWSYVAAVDEVTPGDALGIGGVRRYTWTTRLPYRLVFESRVSRVEPPYLLEASVDGQLIGVGRWRLQPTDSTTRVRYDWTVRTGVAWMNLLAPIARPFFAWNHDAVMLSGARGLERLLGVQVRDLSAQAGSPIMKREARRTP